MVLGRGLRVRIHKRPPWTQNLVAYADSAYANVDHLKSQFGIVVAIFTDSTAYQEGQFDKGTIIMAYSRTAPL